MSDIFWAHWFRDNPNVANIRYFWVQEISNSDTHKIMARALNNVKGTMKGWPGTTFSINTDEGKALLGKYCG
jgi:hypothetical protein